MEELTRRLREIEAALKLENGENLDEYQHVVVKSILLANHQSEKRLDEVTQILKKNVQPQHYHDLKPLSSFMLKWGFTIPLIGVIFALVAGYSIYSTYKLRTNEMKRLSDVFESTDEGYMLRKNLHDRYYKGGQLIIPMTAPE